MRIVKRRPMVRWPMVGRARRADVGTARTRRLNLRTASAGTRRLDLRAAVAGAGRLDLRTASARTRRLNLRTTVAGAGWLNLRALYRTWTDRGRLGGEAGRYEHG